MQIPKVVIVKRPQSNGETKMQFGTHKQFTLQFAIFGVCNLWYTEIWPYQSLNNEEREFKNIEKVILTHSPKTEHEKLQIIFSVGTINFQKVMVRLYEKK
jgi:hypothetical protein